ncbi:MAG: hypothetical protein OXD32_02530, partial [Endozoicomonadaceae bacterium]|nr:hypothetical protein [Endozoicomonadaceae bacterium]
MFKIIKWHSLICTIILLFVIVTTRAGLDTEDPTEQARLNEVVALLDQQAEKWNYKRFNWAYLYPYLSQYIKCADFVNATQYDGYSCITALAEKLLRAEKLLSNSSIDTIQDAKMLIYSALNSLYFAHVEGRRKNMAELLKQVNTAMQPYQSYPILKPARQNQEAAVKTLVSYRDCFILNNDIAELRLADKFIDLIRNINFFVDITKPLKKNSLSSLEMTILPKVKEIMKYYSGCEETVFIFLVNASVKELEGRAHCPYLLQSEQRLILAISDAFRKLWSYLNLT